MKKLSARDKFIKDNLAKYAEYYMIVTCKNTGKTHYYVITNLYCDPFYFIDLKDDYRKGFYLPLKGKRFFNLFNKYKTIFVEMNSSLGFDRVIYKRINNI